MLTRACSTFALRLWKASLGTMATDELMPIAILMCARFGALACVYVHGPVVTTEHRA